MQTTWDDSYRKRMLNEAVFMIYQGFYQLCVGMQDVIDGIILKEQDVPGAYFSNDPAEYTVSESRHWLECHGQKKQAKKQKLINRIRGCIAIQKGVDHKIDGGKWYKLKKQDVM